MKIGVNETFNMYFGVIEYPRCKVDVTHPLVDILNDKALESILVFISELGGK